MNYEIKNALFEREERDPRDLVAGIEITMQEARDMFSIPDRFIIDNDIYHSQDKKGYEMSCGSQGTINAINSSKKIKLDQPYLDPFAFRDKMIEKGLAGLSWGSYVEDNVKEAKKEGYIKMYYRVNSVVQMVLAIYKTDCIVTGSNKINWKVANDTGEVRAVTKGVGHCIAIIGFDFTKKIGDYNPGAFFCKNSYGVEFGDNGGFWLPFDIAIEALFNAKIAMYVLPEWSKNLVEERKKELGIK